MTRWIKIYRDLWNNRSRTILVILSITLGTFAVGMILSTHQALTTSLTTQYKAMHPAEIILYTEPYLDDDFIASIRHMRGVDDAEGRRSLPLRISLDGSGEIWRDMTLFALSDYNDQHINKIWQQGSGFPPTKGTVLMERASMNYLKLKPGDIILVKTAQSDKFKLTVAGTVHDTSRIPPIIEGWVYGYISMDTLRWMNEPEGYNELYIDSSASTNAELRDTADRAGKRIEGKGLPVYQKSLPDPEKHPLEFIIQTVLLLLGLLAVLSMLLSCLLVINVVSALIAQQERQIGIMKAIGARASQIIGIYVGIVLILGLAACLLAIPFSNLGANALAAFVAELINFDSPPIGYSPSILLVQLGIGLLVPLISAAPAIFNGTKVSPARVLSEYGISQVWGGVKWIDAFLNRFPRLTRETLLALRNPWRKRGRLILSLLTLTFAGAVFMANVNLQASLNISLDQMLGFWKYDAWLVLDQYISVQRLVSEASSVPGVGQVEAWGFSLARYVRQDGTESENLYLLAPPSGSKFLNPPIIAGRLLLPDDTNAILVSPGLLANEPAIHLGSVMNVKIEGREEPYHVVGVMQMMGNSSIGYFTVINYSDYVHHVREPNRANAIVFTITQPGLDAQRRIASAVESQFDSSGISVLNNFLIAEERQEIDAAFSVVVALLMVMTLLLAAVGGLGLMGSMSLNVIERTREIGVMRAYGASDTAVFRVVILEGLLIGCMSWLLSIGLSLPISILLAQNIGLSFMDYPMQTSFSVVGIVAWAVLITIISIIASFLPALRAVRLTVTEVLAYE